MKQEKVSLKISGYRITQVHQIELPPVTGDN